MCQLFLLPNLRLSTSLALHGMMLVTKKNRRDDYFFSHCPFPSCFLFSLPINLCFLVSPVFSFIPANCCQKEAHVWAEILSLTAEDHEEKMKSGSSHFNTDVSLNRTVRKQSCLPGFCFIKTAHSVASVLICRGKLLSVFPE